MKVAILSFGDNLDSAVHLGFEQADYVLIVDAETLSYDSFLNPDAKLSDSSGIHKTELFSHYKVDTLITGRCNNNAAYVLKTTGINVLHAKKGNIKDNIVAFKNNELKPILLSDVRH